MTRARQTAQSPRFPSWDDSNDRAMLICRISDKKQSDGVSLDAQRHQQERYVARVGLQLVAIESFQESAKKSALRSQFHTAIERARRENILEQLGTAVDAIVLTPELADAIADGLNATHKAAVVEKARSAQKYRAEIEALKQKQDRLFDRYDRGEIDRDTYDRQLARVRADEADRFEKLREADAATDTKYLVTAERVLELAKNARSLWEGRSDEEKRDLVAKLVCNPRLDGRTVRYDLQKHFAALAQMRGEGGWRPQGDSNPC